MSYGFTTFGRTPYAAPSEESFNATVSKFRSLLDDPTQTRVYLLEMFPFDATTEPLGNDLTSNANHATLVNNPGAVKGRLNTALQLNGTDQYADVGDLALFDFDATQDFTVEVWVKTTRTGDSRSILHKGNASSGLGYELLWPSFDSVRARVGDGTDSASVFGGNIANGAWRHLAMVVDRTAQTLEFLVDGDSKGTSDISAVGSLANSTNLLFGRRSDSSAWFWDGELDDIRIWNVARTQAQLQNNKDSELTGSESGLIGYWRMNNGEVTKRFSHNLIFPSIDDSFFPVRMTTVFNSEVGIGEQDTGPGGGSRPRFGEIRLAIGDQEQDDLLDLFWDGRKATLLMGGTDFAFDEFQKVFEGTIREATWTEEELILSIRDKTELLRLPVQENLYQGTGTFEGGNNVKGQIKPLALGKPRNVTPVLIDRGQLLYQVHDGPMIALPAVRDQGVDLTRDGDVSGLGLGSIFDWTPVPGRYVTDLSLGVFRLGAQPVGIITCDPEGSTVTSDTTNAALSGSFESGELEAASGGGTFSGFEATAGELMRFAVERVGLTDDDLDLASFTQLNIKNSAPLSLYIRDGSPTAVDILDRVANSIGAFWIFNRLAQLTVGVVGFTAKVTDIDKNQIVSIERLETALPTWRRRIGYAQNWTIQDESDIAAGATDTIRDFVRQEFRVEFQEDASLRTSRKLAEEVRIDTLIDTSADAAAEVDRQQRLFGVSRDQYRLVVKEQQFLIRIGHTIRFSFPRWGLATGLSGIVLSVAEDVDREETTLRVWG